MAKWKIEFRDVGHNRFAGTLLVDAVNLVKAKQHAIRACRRHVSGAGNLYLEARGHYTYCIVLGMDEVGEVRLTCLEPCSQGVA
jgi:hypothetical protein